MLRPIPFPFPARKAQSNEVATEGVPSNAAPHAYPYGDHHLGEVIRADIAANRRDPASQSLLVALRCTQYLVGRLGRHHPVTLAATAADRLYSELLFNVELRPATTVGPGLSIYHRTGLVVNDHAVIGSHVTLRHNVTIGHRDPAGNSPVIGDNVEVGAGALILGDITIGDGAKIAAGSVVVKPVPADTTVAGNPAKPLRSS